ncbi:MAG: site-specific integrase [Clostridia bacterium]|nr:site-specific integrase [Clostridia bacterium]
MVRRKDGRFQETVTINGKRKYFYGKSKAEVLRKMAAFQQEQNRGALFSSVAEAWEGVHREEIGEKTWLNYKPHYKEIIDQHGNTPVSEITAQDVVADLRRAAAQGRSITIISTRRSIYRMILDHALASGLIPYNPAIGVQLPKGPKRRRREAPDDSTMETILANTDKPFGVFVALLALTGLRKSEALALTWGDIKKDRITVNKALDYTVHSRPKVKPPKTEAGNREVPILSPLRPLLKRPKGAADTDLLFPSKPSNRNPSASGHMTEREYEGAWKRYCAAVGFVDVTGKPTLTAHQLRHGMATMGFEAGVDELTMQAILGHASPTTTRDIYTHLRAAHRVKEIENLDGMISKMVSKSLQTVENKEK